MAVAALEPDGDPVAVEDFLTALATRQPVDLAQVLATAALTTRVDQKYVVPIDLLPELAGRLPERLAVLNIGGRRVFDYESVYFDTDCFDLYRHHVQGRRKRYKARTRTYRDTGEVMLEVKLKGHRGATVKQRLPYAAPDGRSLTGPGREFLHAVVDEAYGLAVPELTPRLTTAYRRCTLVDLQEQSRTTIDLDLTWSDGETACAVGDLALIESKSASGAGAVDAVLASMGVRPVRLSKYCIGVALLHPDMAANRWNRLLVRQFGWQRSAAAG